MRKEEIKLGNALRNSLDNYVLEELKKDLHINYRWTCSDYLWHSHRWKFTAWLCGRIQYLLKYIP